MLIKSMGSANKYRTPLFYPELRGVIGVYSKKNF